MPSTAKTVEKEAIEKKAIAKKTIAKKTGKPTAASNNESSSTLNISNKKIESILHDAEKAAKAVKLVYVHDTVPGITRIKSSDNFHYYLGKKKIQDELTLGRIKKLVIPPAWEAVWICALDNGHLQATGIDVKKRKQYKYHTLWNALRNHTKFYRLYEFGKTIPAIRQQLEHDLLLPGLPVEKVLALVICLMEQTSIRIGNSAYEKLYGSFGLTTLKDKHVKIDSAKIQFIFKGKKGIAHNISIINKRLAKIVQQCRDIPGKELFQYYDHEGAHKAIDSGMVNSYLKNITGQDFTAKDFRTWAGTVHAIRAFNELWQNNEGFVEPNEKEIKTTIVTVIDRVAEHLGNTRAVCKKYYVHPAIITLYETQALHPYLKLLEQPQAKKNGLTVEEKLLLTILEKENLVHI